MKAFRRTRIAGGCSGQAAVEFAAMLLIAAVLALALLVLFRAFSSSGERMVDLVQMNVP